MKEFDITKFKTVIIDAGNRFYEFDTARTSILEVNSKPVELLPSGEMVFSDTKEIINFKNSQQ